MNKTARILIAALLLTAAVRFPVQAAQTGTAGIEFYSSPGGGTGGGGGGGSPGGGSGGSSQRDTDPPRGPIVEIELPNDEPILMVSPDKPLGRLPETGSHTLPAWALVLAGSSLIAAARRQTPAITVESHG